MLDRRHWIRASRDPDQGQSTGSRQQDQGLQKAGAKKLILDLRNTAEGDPAEGVALANLFLDPRTSPTCRTEISPRRHSTADPNNAITKLPMTVPGKPGTATRPRSLPPHNLENQRGDVLGDRLSVSGRCRR